MVDQPALDEPTIAAASAVVIDLTTGTVVYAKHPLDEHYPASITKIMTAMIALKRGHLNDLLTATPFAVSQPPDKLYLVPGEVEPLKKLLYGLLLISANDAAVVIAQHYGGSVTGFATLMNAEAHSLGAVHTHFVNPNGLPDPRHVTTAYDMALIARAAMQLPEFRTVVRTKYYHWQGQQWQSDLINLNRMLFYYPGVIGVKTGYTNAARNTLVVAATRGQQTFLAVLMDGQLNYQIRHDAASILDFAFAHYGTQTVVLPHEITGALTVDGNVRIPVSTSRAVLATTRLDQPMQTHTRVVYTQPAPGSPRGTVVGHLEVLQNQHLIASVPLMATTKIPQIPPSYRPSWFEWLSGTVILFLLGGWRRRTVRRRRMRLHMAYTARTWRR